MPPKRLSGRPLAPVGRLPAPSSSSSRKTLHTQELMLFSSPVSAVPAKRSLSISKRTAYRHAAEAPQDGRPRKSSQSGLTLSATTSSVSPASTTSEYEPLPAHYRPTPGPFSTEHSSSKATASCAAVTTSDTGRRIPLPPPQRHTPPANGASVAVTEEFAAAPLVASGAGSRVIRLLRDARAVVRDPIRPETPLEAFAALPCSSTGGSVNGSGLRHISGIASLHSRSGGLRTRSQRRLPAGYRLAPMTSTPSQSASPPSASSAMAARSAAAFSGTLAVKTAISGSTDFSSSLSRSSSLLPAQKLSLSDRHVVEQGAGNVRAEPSSSLSYSYGVDAQEFAQLYLPALQAGGHRFTQAVDLLLELKQRLVTSLRSTGKPLTLDGEVVKCLQATLVHFCKHWSTGATLRHAVDRDSSRSSNAAENGNGEGFCASNSVDTTFAPLLYAQGAFLAASILLQCFPVASLVAEPASFQATAHTLHIVAEAGFTEWIARDANLVKVLVEILRHLASPGLGAQLQAQQWVKWILDTVALCSEDAADAAATAADDAGLEPADLKTSRPRQRLHSSDAMSHSSVSASGSSEMDVIRSSGLVGDAIESQLRSTQRRQPPPCVKSVSLQRESFSSHLKPSSGSNASVADVIATGTPTSLLPHMGGGVAALQLAHRSPSNSFEEDQDFCGCLVSLGFLPILQQLTDHALARCAPLGGDSAGVQAGDSPLALLPIIGTLYRCLVQSDPKGLCLLGIVDTLTNMLNTCAADPATVEAAARTLVKLTYVEECLAEMQASTAVIAAAAHALRTQLSSTHTDASRESSIGLLVSRLCGVMARVAEHSTVQQEYLVSPLMAQLLEALAMRYITVSGHADVEQDDILTLLPLPPPPVLQAVVWVLGIASMSPQCPLQLVQSVTPRLVRLLGVLRRRPGMRLTAVYALMCLSNLSYFFGSIESAEEGRSEVEDMPGWLPSLYSSLGLLLAHFLFEDNAEATVEATRVLGNISYTNAGRDWMEVNRCDEVIVLFLGHEDLRVVYNCCGVLLNLTAAFPCRVVQEPELLKMMLSYTARYTDHNRIRAVAAREEARLRQQQSAEDVKELVAEVGSQTAQIADVVEKLLLNVQGVLSVSTASNGNCEI
ncbi:hypothetical protein JKF63_02232 [Porcisia hertigi]|uniref:Uncharacterized protein n=1 Tax=Porcisia hertigi TaxID=2761500 RepID=A0A836H7N6_9TRYP|nr:hypothetical protein JKF63_02232 [Porcisia hertigi]